MALVRIVGKGPQIRFERTEGTVDAAALKKAIEEHRDMVFRVAYTYMRNRADADDVVQDVFVKLFNTKKEFDGDDHLRFWLIRVTINQCKTLFRSPWRASENIEQYASSLEMPTSDHSEILVDVMTLPEKYRVVLVLYYYFGFSSEEVADLLRVSPSTVRTRLARARTKLKSVLEVERNV